MTPTIEALPFRFDMGAHEYVDVTTGEVFPHITGMLEKTGWIDDRWYTEESSDRGTAVHQLTASYDLNALHVESCQSRYRGYLLGHVAGMKIVRPTFHAVEEPLVHPLYRFGGRPDRDITAYAMRGLLEGKSGGPEKSHQLQTALQAILIGYFAGLPPESLLRLCIYWKANGKFKVERHEDRRDFDEARRIIHQTCRF